MSRLAAFIFDVDGTLADTERDGHRIAFNRTFAEAALDWHWSVELYGKLLAISGGKERIRFYLQQLQPHPHPHPKGWGYRNEARLRGLSGEVIAAGDIVPAKKPAPDIYQYVLEKMGLTAAECLVFEDSQHGLQACPSSWLKDSGNS